MQLYIASREHVTKKNIIGKIWYAIYEMFVRSSYKYDLLRREIVKSKYCARSCLKIKIKIKISL